MEEPLGRELTLEFVRVTEAAAVSCARFMGTGDKTKCDSAAVSAMRHALGSIPIEGVVVIGEGEIDEAPMLYIGEKVGTGQGLCVDMAVDPLEGTDVLSKGLPRALSVIAVARKGCLLHAPDMYMHKLAVGPKARGKIDLDAPMSENLHNVAQALGKYVEDLTVVILDRPRNQKLIDDVRKVGSRIKLIPDGDLSPAIAVAFDDSGVDVVAGIGGAPEGVLSAVALKCVGGELLGRLWPTSQEQVDRAKEMGMSDINKQLTMDDLVKERHVIFAATGVTDGEILQGVKYKGQYVDTHSLVMHGTRGTIRFIQARHRLDGSGNIVQSED